MIPSLIVAFTAMLLAFFIRSCLKSIWPYKVYFLTDQVLFIMIFFLILILSTQIFQVGIPTPGGPLLSYKKMEAIHIDAAIRVEILLLSCFLAVYLIEILYHYSLGKLYIYIGGHLSVKISVKKVYWEYIAVSGKQKAKS